MSALRREPVRFVQAHARFGMIAVDADNTRNRQLVQMFLVVSAEATFADHLAHEHFLAGLRRR